MHTHFAPLKLSEFWELMIHRFDLHKKCEGCQQELPARRNILTGNQLWADNEGAI